MVGPLRAREILSSIGWLSLQPEEFQAEVFKRAVPIKFRAGDVSYRLGDPPGGWSGEGSFLSRQPRRLGLTAAIDTTGIYLPLELMDQMAGRDPLATRRARRSTPRSSVSPTQAGSGRPTDRSPSPT
jgi:hypothetical protein